SFQSKFFCPISGKLFLFCPALYFIELLHHQKCLFSSRAIIVQCLFKLTACVCPTGQVGDLFFLAILFIHGISVRLEITFESAQYGQRRTAAPGGAIIKKHSPIQWSVVYPIITLMGSAFLIAIEYFYSRFIYL